MSQHQPISSATGHFAMGYRFFHIITLITLALSTLSAPARAADPDLLTIQLVNYLSGSPVTDTAILAYEQNSDGSLKWRGQGTTDTEGRITLNLPGISQSSVYLLKTTPYNAGSITSPPISSPGSFTFPVGNLEVLGINDASGEILTDTKITVYERLADGTDIRIANYFTDSNGLIRFHIPELGSGKKYFLHARSPIDGSNRYSSLLSDAGAYTFRVGDNTSLELTDGSSAPTNDGSGSTSSDTSTNDGSTTSTSPAAGNSVLNVLLLDGVSNQGIPGITLDAFKLLADGSRKWVATSATDNSGRVVFDLPELSQGTKHVLAGHPYHQNIVYSPAITSAGDFTFKVGTTAVALTRASDGAILANQKMVIREKLPDGSIPWFAATKTGTDGVAHFELPGLDSGRIFIASVDNALGDGKRYYSAWITQFGLVEFAVSNTSATYASLDLSASADSTTTGGGTSSSDTSSSTTDSSTSTGSNTSSSSATALNVLLLDGVSNQGIPGITLDAFKLLADGSRKWVATSTTDNAGRVIFDLPELSQGSKHVLAGHPYHKNIVYSPAISTAGDFTFKVGTTAVALTRAGDGAILANRQITIREKLPDGSIPWFIAIKTGADGVAHFELPGLDSGRVFIASVDNALGNNKRYYSDWITQFGLVEFAVDPNTSPTYASLDLSPPSIGIDTPTSNALVSSAGFTLSGHVADNQAVSAIQLTVKDPLKGETVLTTTPVNGYWESAISGAVLSAGQTVTIMATAFDPSYNAATNSRPFAVIDDTAPPQLSIDSHQNDDFILHNGFLLSGSVTDNTGTQTLTASVHDSSQGQIMVDQPIEIAEDSGRWTLVGEETSPGGQITVKISATDNGGNASQQTLRLKVRPAQLNAAQLLDRITFGATPELLDEITALGPEAFLQSQLNPDSISNGTLLRQQLDAISLTGASYLQAYRLAHIIHSKRQLQEVLTEFWDNHFNTDIGKTGLVGSELKENDQFRKHALGYFRDLLEISATSPTMLFYLDNAFSFKEEPNENYARELMELHTMGVDGGYSEEDVAEVARVFTGWRVAQGDFTFYARAHDDGEKHVLGHTIPAGLGVEGGERVLDILAQHPSSARFICTKLLRLLVDDKPASDLTGRCANVFLDSGGHIGTVVEFILRSPEFNSPAQNHRKVKTPLEYIASINRNLTAVTSYIDSRETLGIMGMPIARNPTPTGWPETGAEWANSNQTLQNLLAAKAVVFNNASTRRTYLPDPLKFFTRRGYETAEGIVGYLFALALGHDYSREEWDQAIGILNEDGTRPFNISAVDADYRVRRLLGAVLGYPSFQLQ